MTSSMNAQKTSVYLDYNASAPLHDVARQVMQDALDHEGNPSSIHAHGRRARAFIEKAREAIAQLVGMRPANVIFTSGATEANNTILHSSTLKDLKIDHILTLGTEHPAILEASDTITPLPVDRSGVVDLNALEEILKIQKGPTVLSIQMANNETGVIQPIQEAFALAKSYDTVLTHSDAVQAAGRIDINMTGMHIDYLSLSSHKIGGPQGVGALIARDLHPFEQLIKGGGQERRRRSGTENTPAIAGFGAAALFVKDQMRAYQEKTKEFQKQIETHIASKYPQSTLFGIDAPRIPNTTLFAHPGKTAEKMLMRFDLEGISVSSGSACSSGSIKPSHVLKAMGYDDTLSSCALRVSTGWKTTQDDIDYFLKTLDRIMER